MFSRFLSEVKKPFRVSCKSNILNKFKDLQELIKGNIDAVMIAKTKTGASLTTAPFLLENYHQSFRLGINSKSGSILVYVK